MKKLICFLLFFILISAKEEEIEHLQEGNLLLRSAQQISPLFSFGQNIIEKGDVQFDFYLYDFKGKNKELIEIIPAFLYGVTDDFSVYLNFPVILKNSLNNKNSSGSGDFFAQFEYAIHNKTALKYIDQVTIVSAITFPTDSFAKIPVITTGEPSIFIGATASHLAIDWYYFASLGATFTKSKKCNNEITNQFGNQYLYQFGFGRNITTYKGWVFTWILEFDGIYNQSSFSRGIKDLNTGGKIFTIAPSIYIANNNWIFQAGIAFPIVQNLFGNQQKDKYWLGFNIDYTL